MTFDESINYFRQNVLPNVAAPDGVDKNNWSDWHNDAYNQWAQGIEAAYFGQPGGSRILELPVEALDRAPTPDVWQSPSMQALQQQYAAAQQNGFPGEFLDWLEVKVVEDPSILQDNTIASYVEGVTGSRFERDSSGNIVFSAPIENIEDYLGGAAAELVASIVNNIPAQMEADRAMIDRYTGSLEGARDAITGRQAMGTFDPEIYLRQNPDVAQWAQAAVANGSMADLAEAARYHYDNYGITESRDGTPEQSRTFIDEVNSVNRFVDTGRQILEGQQAADLRAIDAAGAERDNALRAQVAAQQQNLDTSLAALEGTLEGELAERASALRALSQQLTANFDQYSVEERAALAQQLEQMWANLDQSVAAREGALNQEIEAINAATAQEFETRRAAVAQEGEAAEAALAQQYQTQRAALEQEIGQLRNATDQASIARRSALTQELSTLESAFQQQSGTLRENLNAQLGQLDQAYQQEATARRGALGVELDKLLAAQQPLNAAREQTALAASAAINIGAQAELARIEAARLQDGYVGDGTFNQNARQRALIDANQRAAATLGAAREANAGDIARINQSAATQERITEEQIARDALQNSIYGAGQTRGLEDEIARGTFDLARYGATETRGLDDTDAAARLALDTYAAQSGRALTDAEAREVSALAQRLAMDNRNLSEAEAMQIAVNQVRNAGQTRGLADTVARERQALGDAGATDTRNLSSLLSQQGRALADTNAASEYGENLLAAGSRADLSRFGIGENRGLGDYLATQTRANADNVTGQRLSSNLGLNDSVRNLALSGEADRQNYYLQDLNRQVSAAASLPGLINTEMQLRNAPTNNALNNFNNALGTLFRFGSDAPATAPTNQPILSNYDSGSGALAGALLNRGLDFGTTALQNWLKTRQTGGGGGGGTTEPADPSSPFSF